MLFLGAWQIEYEASSSNLQDLLARAAQGTPVRVIIGVRTPAPFQPEGLLSPQAVLKQRQSSM